MKNTSSNSFDLLPFVLKFALQVNMLNTSFTLGGEEGGSEGYIGRGTERRREIICYIRSSEYKLLVLAWLLDKDDSSGVMAFCF